MSASMTDEPSIVDDSRGVERVDRGRHGNSNFLPQVQLWLREEYTLVVPVIVAFTLCLFRIGIKELSDDELCTWWAVHLPLRDLLRLLHHVDAVLAPYYLLLRLWVGLFGDSAFSLRLPSTLAIATAAGFLSLLGRRMCDKQTGLFAGLFFAVIPAIVRHSHDARPYAFCVLGAVAATLFLLRAIEQPLSTRRWCAYSAAIAFTGAMHLVSTCVVFAHATTTMQSQRTAPWLKPRRTICWRWIVATAGGLLAILPIAIWGMFQAGQLRPMDLTFGRLTSLFRTLPLSEQISFGLVGLACVGAIRRRPYSSMLLVWALLPPVLLYVTYDAIHIFRPRYFIFTLPAWSLLAAAACTELHAQPRWRLAAPVTALVALVLLGGTSLKRLWRPQTAAESPYSQIGRLLSETAEATDVLLYGGPPGAKDHARAGIAYATRHVPPLRDVLVKHTAASLGTYRAVECKAQEQCFPDGTRRVWFVGFGEPETRFSRLTPELKTRIFNDLSIVHRWTFGKITLDLLARKTSGGALPGETLPKDGASDGEATDLEQEL